MWQYTKHATVRCCGRRRYLQKYCCCTYSRCAKRFTSLHMPHSQEAYSKKAKMFSPCYKNITHFHVTTAPKIKSSFHILLNTRGEMNPLLKSCLISSNRSTVTTEADPYFDENNESRHSSRSSILVSTPSLGNNITRSMKDRDPYEIYEPVKLLGSGSMVRWPFFCFEKCSLLFVKSSCFSPSFCRYYSLCSREQ